MPVCKSCGQYGATAEFRRLPQATGYVCKDKYQCVARRKKEKAA